jgi:hypothetical protein
MVIKFEKQEIEFLKKKLVDRHQALGMVEFFSVVMKTYNKLEYPITSFSDFIKKLSKEKAIKKNNEEKITIGNIGLTIDLIKSSIPAYYFPISSKEDLEDKAMELYRGNTAGIRNRSERKDSRIIDRSREASLLLPASKAHQIPLEKIPEFPEEYKAFIGRSKQRKSRT